MKELLSTAVSSGITLMGDDLIGFKFIGKNSSFWNNLLSEKAEEEELLTMSWLNENGIPFLPYDHKLWNQKEASTWDCNTQQSHTWKGQAFHLTVQDVRNMVLMHLETRF